MDKRFYVNLQKNTFGQSISGCGVTNRLKTDETGTVLYSMNEQLFFTMLRYAMGISDSLPEKLSEADWVDIHRVSKQQALLGVMYTGIKRMPEALRPPRRLLLQWYGEAERVARANALVSEEARRFSSLFAERGYRTCILKGQGNARLYPEPLARTPGDVDIWVEGDREAIISLVHQMGFTGNVIRHHMEFVSSRGVPIEVHFCPASGSWNPSVNRVLQQWLRNEIAVTEEWDGYRVPTARFNRVMQLSHLLRHLVSSGVGLRHLMDYYYVLRQEICEPMDEELRRLGLLRFTRAVMYVMEEVFHLEESYFPVQIDRTLGRKVLKVVMRGGDFGTSDPLAPVGEKNFLKRNILHTLVHIQKYHLFPGESFWHGIARWKRFFAKRIFRTHGTDK